MTFHIQMSDLSMKYPQRFREIYSLSKQFSDDYNSDFEEVFNQAVKFHDPQYSQDQIMKHLETSRSNKTISKSISSSNSKNYDVWLPFGETGQGKSTFTNSICGSAVAEEGKGIQSTTKVADLHVSDQRKIIMVDTPGLFDTRRIKNKEVSKQVINIVQRKLKQNAHIKAIFVIWSPTMSMKFRFDGIMTDLKKALGEEAINSVVFVINKVSHLWAKEHEESLDEFLDLLDERNLSNPVYQCDLKQLSQDDVKKLKELSEQVQPFGEEDFEANRMMIYYDKFLKTQKIDEQKKRDREDVEREIGMKFEKRSNEIQAKFKEDAQKMEEKFQNVFQKQEAENNDKNMKLQAKHESGMNALKERNNQLESEVLQEKERSKREAEKNNHSKDFDLPNFLREALPIFFESLPHIANLIAPDRSDSSQFSFGPQFQTSAFEPQPSRERIKPRENFPQTGDSSCERIVARSTKK